MDMGKENKKMSQKNSKKKWIIIAIAVAIIAIVIGVVVAANSGKSAEGPQGTVEFITKRTIANSISGNGTIEAANKEDVTGGSYGMTVESVNVAEGDIVNKGDIICVFDTSNIDEQIESVEEQIAEYKSNKTTQLADYDKQIEDSKNSTAEDLEEAKANLATAEAELVEAEAELAARQKKYDDAVAAGGLGISDETDLLSQISSQEMVVDSAQARVDSYNAQIDSLEDSDTSALEDAKENYEEQMDTSIDNLEEQLETLREQKDDATIVAGISGTITALNVTEGAQFNGGTIASIEGVDRFIVEAQIEEYDIPDIEVGMKVLIKTDATREEELEGVVTYVAPRATNSGGSSNGLASLMGGMDTSSMTSSGSATYLVKIELTKQNDRLRLGMNAKTSIITEERVDVWTVPYDAIYTRTDGSTYVERVTGKDEEGQILTEEMDVKVGLQGTYYVEVISDDITEDTQILVPDAQGNSSIEELLNMMGADAGI